MQLSLAKKLQAFATGIDANRRPVRLNFGALQARLGPLLNLQHADIDEALMSGVAGTLTCVSTSDDLDHRDFLGLPVSVCVTTDQGAEHTINAIFDGMKTGQSNGELTCYQLSIVDAYSLHRRGRRSRKFLNQNAPYVISTVLSEWRTRSAAFARVFEFDLSGLDSSAYPARSLILQENESDSAFLERLCRREGITMFVKAGPAKQSEHGNRDGESPIHTLVFCDGSSGLPQAPAGRVRYHPRDAATEQRDSVFLFAPHRTLVSGHVGRSSWNLQSAAMDEAARDASIDQGAAGNDLARELADIQIDIPRAGHSSADHDRLTANRMLAYDMQGEQIDCTSNIRNLAVGSWLGIDGLAHLDAQSPEERDFTIIAIHHSVWNNLPAGVHEQAGQLFELSHNFERGPTARKPFRPVDDQADTRYENSFSCVRRRISLKPEYDPYTDRQHAHLLTGVVVTPGDEEVWCDELGRPSVQIMGLYSEYHTHQSGAGTSGTASDSPPIRVLTAWAGERFGISMPLRKGMEVLLAPVAGEADRLVIIGVLSNGKHIPAQFHHTGDLPGNRALSGIVSREIKGARANQLQFDDTSQQISMHLGSDHAASAVNGGFLTKPRDNGQGDPRGEGIEVRTDANASVRGGKGVLISAWQQLKASGHQLDREECLQLMQECVDLFKSLGDYAAQHEGIAADTTPHQDLVGAVQSWPSSGAAQGSGGSGSAAAVAITSPDGVGVVTPKTVATHAGKNVDTVALESVQTAAGQKIKLDAGHDVALFSQGGDVSAIANQGKVKLQSQGNDTLIDSAKNIQFTAAGGKLIGMSKDEVVFTTAGGAYLKLHGSNVELGCPGQFIVKSAGHTWDGPASMSADLPTFSHAPLSRVPKLVRATDGQPSTDFVGEVQRSSGGFVSGQTDAAGRLSQIDTNQFEKLTFNFFEKE
ncbi:type VI secretion system Vgr family protein [Burkholderia sp. Ac-20349]|uniref:type VI secretion system Vgr family protein n=1 Tax=Burkholderia sp. Ac-20349 TaxID=2703893 RepID=UPI00197B3DAA|nr:type VI secretion system Vgr family protein [Burkholderia sp. Ac-20349]MBN3838033.1 type VI secretion system tip protein VgrG [Burkholderia sp. Ac-20349]